MPGDVSSPYQPNELHASNSGMYPGFGYGGGDEDGGNEGPNRKSKAKLQKNRKGNDLVLQFTLSDIYNAPNNLSIPALQDGINLVNIGAHS